MLIGKCDLLGLDSYLTELRFDPCSEVNEVSKSEKYGNIKRKKAKLVCIPHATATLHHTIKKIPKHKTMRVNGKWVV